MAAAAGSKFFLPSQGEFYRAPYFTGDESGAEFPGSHLHFAAETTADKRFDDADIIFPHLHGRGQQTLNKVGSLS